MASDFDFYHYDLWKAAETSELGTDGTMRVHVKCPRGHRWLVNDPKHFICWTCAALDYDAMKKKVTA